MALQVTPFTLPETARRSLNQMLRKGVHPARTLNRARILIKLDQGIHPRQVADDVGVCLATVYNIRKKATEQDWQYSLKEGKHTGTPAQITAEERTRVTALACSTPPDGRAQWTLRLLADQAVELGLVENISHSTVGRILKKTNSGPT